MSDKYAYNLIPGLRFPDFICDKEWKELLFGKLFTFLPNNTLSRADLKEGEGDVYNVHYGDVLIKLNAYTDIQQGKLPAIKNVNDISKYQNARLQDGDVVIADTAEDETVGKCTEIVNTQETIVVSGLHTIPCRPRIKFAQAFLGYYMNSSSFHNRLRHIMQGVKVTSISKTALQNIYLTFPESFEEQQKIADCLSSIDSYISSINEKIEQLKAHKKSLMQKLFPQNGKTVPEYRFPEFEKDGAWELKKIKEIAEVYQGYGFPEKMQGKKEGRYPFIKVSDISSTVNNGDRFINTSANYIDEYDLLSLKATPIPTGSVIFAKIGEAIRLNRRVILNQDSLIDNNVAGIKANTEILNDNLMYYVLSMIDLTKYAGGVVPAIKKSALENIEVLLPTSSNEKKIIAGILVSIDNLLYASKQKIICLEQQKKGLMQQFFPQL